MLLKRNEPEIKDAKDNIAKSYAGNIKKMILSTLQILTEDDDIFKHSLPNITQLIESIPCEEYSFKEQYLQIIKNLLKDKNAATEACTAGFLVILTQLL